MRVDVTVPDGISGDWSITSFSVGEKDFSQMISMVKYGRGVPAGNYKRLMRNGVVVMSNTPDEIRDGWPFVYNAKGSVLVNGLGMGVILKMLLDKPDVTDITVIENSEDVIKLVAVHYKDPRLTIIHDSAFTYKPPKGKRYNAVWHDIWDNITADNLPEMKQLHRKYGRISDFQLSWARSLCEAQERQDKRESFYWR